jgi:uncharacterized membrane protein YraQ (UPF0718 family)
MKEKRAEKKKKGGNGGWYYLLIVVIVYALVAVLRFDIFLAGVKFFWNLTLRILPIFALVIILMTIANALMTPRFIRQHLQRSGMRKWLFMVIAGILSTGPIFIWYPFLSDIRDKGMGYGPLATFLYNRAIKIPLLPVAIYYFGWQFVLVLTIVMIAVSIIQGIVIDRLIPCEV